MTSKTDVKKRIAKKTPAKPPRGARKHRAKTHRRKQQRRKSTAPNFLATIEARKKRHDRKRRLITVVSVLMMVIGAALLIYPFTPMIRYAIAKPQPVTPYETRLTSLQTPLIVSATTDETETPAVQPTAPQPSSSPVVVKPGTVVRPKSKAVKPKPADNRLVIPKIGVDVAIVEGKDQEAALNKGIWHIPNTSTPDRGGNTVLSGHRFRYLSGPKTLYLLDKLKKGDPIIIYWKGKEYDYAVVMAKIVKPNQVGILDNTKRPQLTIFTCSPLFSTKERLVLIAKPI